MTQPRILLIAVALIAIAIVGLAQLRVGEAADPLRAAASPAPATSANAATASGPASAKFYFDVVDHSQADFHALLLRAHSIYEQTPPAERAGLEVVMVLHGPDIQYFDSAQYDDYHEIVDLAAKLDAFGVLDFKACRVAATNIGIDADRLPPFVEFVPYGPGEIDRLKRAGYTRL